MKAQKSVVVLSELPFVALFKRVVQLVGSMYFEAGSAVLEVAKLNIAAWCVLAARCAAAAVVAAWRPVTLLSCRPPY